MDKQLQQRLTGAAIIVALVVIFVPELVKQPESDQAPMESLDRLQPLPAAPPQPATTTITLGEPAPGEPLALAESEEPEPAVPLTDLEPLSEAPLLVEELTPLDGGESEFAAELPPIEPVAVAPPIPPPARPAPTPQAVRPAPPPAPPAVRPEPPPPQVAAVTPPPAQPELPRLELISRPMAEVQQGQPRWMVQAGSFSDVSNANSLRDQLRSRNFSATLTSTVIDGRTMYRVQVGPHSSRDEGERTRERLQRELSISGSVIPVYN